MSTPHPAALAAAVKTDEDQRMRSGYMTEWRQTRVTERRMLDNNAKALRRMFEWRVPPSRIEEYVQRLSEPGALTAALNWYARAVPAGRSARSACPRSTCGAPRTSLRLDGRAGHGELGDGAYRFEMFEDVSHWVPEEAPEALVSVLLEHLSAH